MSLLKMTNVSKSFNGIPAIDAVNLAIEEGEITSIIGTSGAGKSTLLRIICDLEKADSGDIELFGVDIMKNDKYIKNKGFNEEKKNTYKKIGFIFQDFNLFDNLTVKENIELAPRLQKIDNYKEKTNELLEMVSLKDKINNYPNTLSGGEKQRISIVRALALEPKFILFDEPTSALDVENIQELVYTINKLSKKNITMLIVTHDLAFAKQVSKRLIFMEKAKILFDSNSDDNSIDNKRMNEFLNMR